MTPRPTIFARVLSIPVVRVPRLRRLVVCVLALILLILTFFPEHYLAEAQLMPQDSGGGLSSALASQGSGGGLLSLGALLGNKQPVEADLTIARSQAVVNLIIKRLRLVGKSGFSNLRNTQAKIAKKIGIIAIRGSILQITVQDSDAERARALAAASAQSIQDRLTQISLEQAAQKRTIASSRLGDATLTLARTQAALTNFRTANKLAAPDQQLGAAVGLLASLEGRLQAKRVEVETLRSFATGSNITLQSATTELAALEHQVTAAKVQPSAGAASNLAGMSGVNETYYNLYRDEKSAEILYEVYRRYLEEVTVDELSANENLILVEPAYVHPERQLNVLAIALLFILLATEALVELYWADPSKRDGRRFDGPSRAES